MKRVKFMLAAIVVVAGVGGALAFKAKKSDTAYCIANQSGACQIAVASKFDFSKPLVWYTTTNDLDRCTAVQCTSQTSLTNE